MATVKVTTVISSFSFLKMLVFALMASVILAVLVSISIKDFQAVKLAGQKWTPGYGKALPKVPYRRKSGTRSKGLALGLKSPSERNNSDYSYKAFLKKKQLPTVLIIGFPNSGVRVLRELLSLHPGIVAPRQEVEFFTLNYRRGPKWYKERMPLSTPNQITLEATQNYIMSPLTLERIYRFAGFRLIIVAQDPVNRLLATYIRETSRQKPPRQTFIEWCGFVYNSPQVLKVISYEATIREVYKRFTQNGVLVISKEDLERDPQKAMREALNFMGLKPYLSAKDFQRNSQLGINCFNTQSRKYQEIKRALTPGVVLHIPTGCIGDRGKTPYTFTQLDEKDFFRKVVGVAMKNSANFFRIIRKNFQWTSKFN